MGPFEADELDRTALVIESDGLQGIYVEAFAAPDNKDQLAILGAILTAENHKRFVKLFGQSGLAADQREEFRDFVESIKFPAMGEAEHGK